MSSPSYGTIEVTAYMIWPSSIEPASWDVSSRSDGVYWNITVPVWAPYKKTIRFSVTQPCDASVESVADWIMDGLAHLPLTVEEASEGVRMLMVMLRDKGPLLHSLTLALEARMAVLMMAAAAHE